MLPKGRLDCNRFLDGSKVILVFGNDPAGTNNKFVVVGTSIGAGLCRPSFSNGYCPLD
jgi:hypothetical protein